MDSYLADLGAALSTLNSATINLTILAGVAVGIVLGALPGFGSSQALALLFPVTFAMSVDQAVLFLIAVYSAVEYGSSIPAILIRTPGTGASAVTLLDGYTMARQGLARRALRISLYSRVIGGTTSTIIFIVAGTSLGYVALAFGPGELFAVGVFGLAIVGGFFGKDAARGFLAVAIGLLLATIGSSGTAFHWSSSSSHYSQAPRPSDSWSTIAVLPRARRSLTSPSRRSAIGSRAPMCAF